MFTEYGVIRKTSRAIRVATDHTCEELRGGEIRHEPDFTGSLLRGIADELRHEDVRGVSWKRKVLNAAGPGSEEKRYGADFLGVLSVDLPDYSIRKGFIAQAKLVRGRWSLAKAE
jgi:hypothetical protein